MSRCITHKIVSLSYFSKYIATSVTVRLRVEFNTFRTLIHLLLGPVATRKYSLSIP